MLVGGLLYAAIIGLPISKTVSQVISGPIMVKAIRRLSFLMWTGIILVFLTGMHRIIAVNHMVTKEAWLGNAYGIVLMVKLALVVATIVGLGLINFWVYPAIKRHLATAPCSQPSCAVCAKNRKRLTFIVWNVLLNVAVIMALAAMLRVGV